MADSNSHTPGKEAVTSDNFMTKEELEAKHRQKFRELEVLRSELNSG